MPVSPRLPAVVCVLATLAAGLAPTAAVASAPAPHSGPATVVTDPDGVRRGPAVLVGVAGLRWSDVSPERTPALWSSLGGAALASVTVRATQAWTCAGDGWLTVGAGRRAEQPRPPQPSPPDGVTAPVCPPLPTVAATVDAAKGSAQVDGWDEVVRTNDDLNYDAEPGLLAETLAATDTCATAVGPGAALALADRGGRVASYSPDPAGADLTRCRVTVVDLGAVTVPGFVTVQGPAGQAQPYADRVGSPTAAELPTRAEQVAALDRRWADLAPALDPAADVLLVNVADSSREAHLGVAATGLAAAGERSPAAGPAPEGTPPPVDGPSAAGAATDTRWLETRSTRRSGLVQLTDVLPTLLTRAGVSVPPTAIGAAWTDGAGRPLADAVDELQERDTAAVVSRTLLGPFTIVLVLSQLLLYTAAGVALSRLGGGDERARRRVLRVTRRAALVFAALPIASYLANLVPWWRHGNPLPALLVALLVAAVLVAAAAAAGPWRRHLMGPPGAIAVVTALVLTADVANGSPLQLNAVLGYSPLVAGRFYGFGNIAFALFAASTIMGTAALAARLVETGRRRAAAGFAAAAGLVAVVVDGSDRLGTDFGGVIALVPGFAVLGMGLAGARTTVRRLALALGAGVVAVAVLATVDWLRPAPDRTHLGRFVQQVIDGEARTVIGRKADANLDLLIRTPYGLIVPAAVAFLVFVLSRPQQSRAAALDLAYATSPTLRPGLFGAVTALVVGFAVNDSGIVIPAVGLAIVVPLALAAAVTALERATEVPPPAGPTPPASPPAPARARA